MSSYQPGVCNIGRAQRRRRFAIAGAAFGAAGATVLAYVAGVLPAPLLGSLFVFFAVGFEWGLQAYTAFCVRLALANRYDFRGDGGKPGTVTDADAQNADRIQAARITAVAILLAALSTAIVVALLV